MEHLSKQQIVLLTLLVSFVTSIATGIVTVSLMDQAPVGVTQTINRVVERTIERVVAEPAKVEPQTASVVIAVDPIIEAVEKVSKSVVRIKPSGGASDSVTGLGLVVSNEGVIVTDKSAVSSLANLQVVFHDGQEFPINVIQSQIDGDIVFLVPVIPNEKKSVIVPSEFALGAKLGQSVIAISGKDKYKLSQGIVEGVPEANDSVIETSIDSNDLLVGSPLFNPHGEVVGFNTTSLTKTKSFYLLSYLKPNIPKITP